MTLIRTFWQGAASSPQTPHQFPHLLVLPLKERIGRSLLVMNASLRRI